MGAPDHTSHVVAARHEQRYGNRHLWQSWRYRVQTYPAGDRWGVLNSPLVARFLCTPWGVQSVLVTPPDREKYDAQTTRATDAPRCRHHRTICLDALADASHRR